MLMTREESNAVIDITGCSLAKICTVYKGYNGDLYDVVPYHGKLGNGWSVTKRKTCEIYVADKGMIYEKIYNGEYTIDFNRYLFPKKVNIAGVEIEPVYEIQLDTMFGDVVIRQTDSYRASVLIKNLLVIYVTNTDVKDIKRRIRRKLRNDINSGKAVLLGEADAYVAATGGDVERVFC